MLLQESHDVSRYNIVHFVQHVYVFTRDGQPYWCGGTQEKGPHEKETRLRLLLSAAESSCGLHLVQCPRCGVIARMPVDGKHILID